MPVSILTTPVLSTENVSLIIYKLRTKKGSIWRQVKKIKQRIKEAKKETI